MLTLVVKIEACSPEDIYDALFALSNILDHVKFEFITEHFIQFLIDFLNKSSDIPDLFSTTLVLKILGQIMPKYKQYHCIIYDSVRFIILI